MRSFEPSSLMPGQGTRRLFIGLMASPASRSAIDDYRSMWRWPPGSRLTPSNHLHVTLHFLGEVVEVVEDALRQELDRVEVPLMMLELQHCEAWAGGVAVLRPHSNDALGGLRSAVGDAMARVALPVEPRPFVPHVTLARNATGATWPQLLAPISWAVTGLSLVWSRAGNYQELERWPVQAGHRSR